MKMTIGLLTIACLQLSAKGLTQYVTLTVKNASLEKVFKEVKRQTGYEFWYESKLLKNAKKVTLEVKNTSLENALDECFRDQPFTYSIVDKIIVVRLNPLTGFSIQRPIATETAVAPPELIDITGTVTDDKGQPLEGATILVKGTNKGTKSDANGSFSIDAEPNSTLVISFVGFESVEIKVGGRRNITVQLKPSVSVSDDVLVIGYGKQKRRDISTSVSSVSSEQMKDKPVSNFTQAISGQMAGVRILNSNNAPGGGTNIIIRGIGSINASNNALIVIDGFPLKDGFDQTQNPLNSINPADIESVEVLKDASAGAIYGALAANGVIIITTKKGKLGKPTISVNISTGYENIINRMEALNRNDFLQYMQDSRSQAYIVEDPNFGTDNPNLPQWQWTDDDATRVFNWTNFSQYAAEMQTGPGAADLYERWAIVVPEVKAQLYDTDWQDVATQTGKVLRVQLSTTGGTENVKYMISGGYYNQEGVMKATGYERFSMRANVELKVTKWMKIGLLLAPSLENFKVMSDLERTFYDVIKLPPIYSPYDDYGNPAHLAVAPNAYSVYPYDYRLFNLTGNTVNPLINHLLKDNRRVVRNLSTIYGEVNILKDLVFRSEFHTEFLNSDKNFFRPSTFPQGTSLTSRSYGMNDIDTRLYWNSQNFFIYDHSFGQHNVNAVLGYSVDEASVRSSHIIKYDYATAAIPTLNQAATILNSQNDARTNRFSEANIGAFSRVMYNYAGKYYLTGTVRRDGSSKFGANKKWGIFPSLSAAWRISDESFFTPVKKYINEFKIRGGWGTIGNSGIGNYNALSTLTSSSYPLGSGSSASVGYVDQRVANAGLGWESTKEYGIGIDVELLKSRILLSVDYFYRLTEDLLFSMPLPTITGFNSYLKNIGSMRNRGFEYLLRTRNFVGNFNWSTTFNLSYYRNRVLSTGKDKRPLIENNSYTIEGKPIANIYATYFLGPYRDWEDVKTNPIVNASIPSWLYRSSPGTAKLFDVNGDGVIDALDNTIIGSPNPDFIWGMTNTFGYKGFDLSIQINGVQGGDHLITGDDNKAWLQLMARGGGDRNTVYSYFDNYWRPDRTDAKYATPSRKQWDETSNVGTLLFKTTYVNFQNVTLGYSLPKKILKRMNLNQVRIFSSIQNAFLFTKYPGYNPEVNSSGNSALSQGIDDGSYPMTRIVSFGFNVLL